MLAVCGNPPPLHVDRRIAQFFTLRPPGGARAGGVGLARSLRGARRAGTMAHQGQQVRMVMRGDLVAVKDFTLRQSLGHEVFHCAAQRKWWLRAPEPTKDKVLFSVTIMRPTMACVRVNSCVDSNSHYVFCMIALGALPCVKGAEGVCFESCRHR